MTFPDWLVPMAATLTQERFTGPEWTFERKYDGIRLITFKHGSDVKMYSRNHLLQHVPLIAAEIARLPHPELILDGELSWDQRDYHVFDVLWRDGRDLREWPLDARRSELATLPLHAPLARALVLDEPEPWERARAEGWEGVIAKRRDSRYEHRRSRSWLKMKIEASQELVVGGFTDPRGKRVGLGALLVGYYEGPDFVFAGKVGTGLDTQQLLAVRARLDALELAEAPFTRASDLPRTKVHWVRPEIVVQVGFMEWTGHGKLRHPRLIGVRADTRARDVTREP
ncbi:MAG: putative ligase-like protein [Myxococcales bacterium]|nr:putative ligase-like protein [Myxococcales bacterium]